MGLSVFFLLSGAGTVDSTFPSEADGDEVTEDADEDEEEDELLSRRCNLRNGKFASFWVNLCCCCPPVVTGWGVDVWGASLTAGAAAKGVTGPGSEDRLNGNLQSKDLRERDGRRERYPKQSIFALLSFPSGRLTRLL